MTNLEEEALSATQTQAREPQHKPESAIVGYAARFPGAQDADAFWDVLRQGRESAGAAQDRWDVGDFYDPIPMRPERS